MAIFTTSVQSNHAKTTKHQWYDFQAIANCRTPGLKRAVQHEASRNDSRGREIAGEICKTQNNNGEAKPSSESLEMP